MTVANSNNRLTDADATTGWASDGGGGAGPQTEPDLGYQLTSGSNYSVSRKVGTTKGGHAYTHGSTTDMTAEANQVVMFKAVWYNAINAVAYPACGLRVGNDSSNHNEYAVIDDGTQGDLDADPKRLVYIVPIDPNVTEWPDIVTGTVTVTAIDFFGIQGDFGGSAKAENVACDAIDLVRGIGVLWQTGTGQSIADIITHDEGTIGNRFGHWSTLRPNVYDTYGTTWIGRTETPTATRTNFSESGKTVIFGKGFFDAGWTGFGFDLGNASTTIDFTDCVLIGQGQSGNKVYFDTITEVDPTPDEVTLDPAPGWVTGTPVIYNNDGGSDTIGLTSGNVYWVERVTDTTFNIHSSRNNARTAATPIALSDGSTGEAHWFQRSPDIRPDLTVTGTSGSATMLRTTFDSWRNLTLTSGITFDTCIFRSCNLIDITTNNGGSLQDCIITGQTTEPGVALVQANTTANIDNNSFTLTGTETGHAIEIDTTGSFNLDGNILTGFWASPDNENGATFDTETGVNGGTEVITTTGNHGFSTGDEVYYNDNGGTETIGLTDGDRYYARAASTTTLTLHRSKENANANTNAVNLTASTAGNGETHTLYSGNAAVVNTSGGSVTLTIGNSGTTPSVRNVGAATTTIVIAPVTTTVNVKDNTGANLQNANVLMEAGDGTGDLPFEESVTITRSATTATVSHTAHGLNTGEEVTIRGANEQEYNKVAVITVTGDNAYTYTVSGSPATPATGTITSTGVVVSGLTNASGQVSRSRSFSANQPVRYRIRKSTSSPYFKSIPTSGWLTDTVSNSTGLTVTQQMILDE